MQLQMKGWKNWLVMADKSHNQQDTEDGEDLFLLFGDFNGQINRDTDESRAEVLAKVGFQCITFSFLGKLIL